MPAVVSPEVFDLAMKLIDWPTGISIACFTGGNCLNEICKASMTGKVSVACSKKAVVDALEHEQNVTVTAIADPLVTRPVDLFHVAFAYPSFGFKQQRFRDGAQVPARVTPVTASDHLAQYMATRFTDSHGCDKHLLEIEQALHSVMAGSFVLAIVPGWYMSSDMRYNRWINANCCIAAKIELPSGAVKMRHAEIMGFKANVLSGKIRWKQVVVENITVDDTKWYLVMFFKGMPAADTAKSRDGKSTRAGGFDLPNTGKMTHELEWAQTSYSSFRATLPSFDHGDVNLVVDSFHSCDWKIAIFQWKKTIAEASYPSQYKTRRVPHPIRADTNMIVVKAPPPAQSGYTVINAVKDIPKESRNVAVLLKPTRSGLKLSGAFPVGDGIACRVQASYGYDYSSSNKSSASGSVANRDTKLIPIMQSELRKDFDTIRADVIKRIEDAGGIPYMLHREVRPLTRRRRRINRQLAAIPRMTPNLSTSSKELTGKFSDASDNIAIGDWSPVFAGIGVKSLFPEEYREWCRRAKKSGVDSFFNYKYQVDDIIECAMKVRVVNGSQMGLGKTRELIQAALLRGTERILIIAPSRLIGTWCDELEMEIEQFYKYRKNWNGRRYGDMQPNIIELAADTAPSKLKLFNIISFDRLKLIPRDAVFYKCARCGMVICKFFADDNPVQCPGEPAMYNKDPDRDMSCIGPYRRWKENMKRTDPKTGKRAYRKYRIDPVTRAEVHWDENHPSRLGIPNSHTEVIDNRDENPYGNLFGGPPDRPVMARQDKMFQKTQLEITGFNAVKTESSDGTIAEIQVPLFRRKLRKCNGKKFHVGWTFSDLLRNRFPVTLWDEIMCVQDQKSLRSMACSHMTSVVRIAATGTPMRGLPQKVISYINLITTSAAFPDYRGPSGLTNFLDRYKTTVIVDGRSKQIPKISNTERFLTEFSSVLLRRVRREPDVRPYLPDITVTFKDFAVKMDSSHTAYYKLFLDLFVEWYEKVLAARDAAEPGVESAGGGDNILAKLTYLRGAAVCPHGVLKSLIDNIKKNAKDGKIDSTLVEWSEIIPPYNGPPTAVTMKILTALKTDRMKGDKSLAFSCRRAALDLGKQCCDKLNIPTIVIDGRVTGTIRKSTGRSPRHLAVEKFRTDNSTAIWAGLGCLNEGCNIPEANHVYFNDTSWEPMDILQGTYRVVRPQQKKPVTATIYYHEGTVSEFMFLVNVLKHRSHAEGTDARSFSDIGTSMIPDFQQYANALVSGEMDNLKRTMMLGIEEYRKEFEADAKSHLDDDVDEEGFDDEENGND